MDRLPPRNTELFPCPKCGRQAETYRHSHSRSSVLVGCDYDCGPYYMNFTDWDKYQDNYDPTPE